MNNATPPPPMKGFGPWEALHHLLIACAKDPGPQSNPVEWGQGDIQDAVVSELERYDLIGRWTQLDASALRSLSLPSLAQQTDGSFLLLQSLRNGRISTLGLNGWQHLRIEELTVGALLDLAPALPQGSLWVCLWTNLLAQRKALLPILTTAFLVHGVALLTPQFTRLLVDKVFPQGAKAMFMAVLVASAFLGLYQAWVGWLQYRMELVLETRLSFVIEQGLMARLLRLPYRWTSGRTVGGLLQAFFGLRAAKDLLTGSLFGTIVNSFTALAYLALMVNLLPGATILTVALILGCMAMTVLAGVQIARLQRQAVAAQVRERSFLVEIINGVAVFKASGVEHLAESRWMNLARRRRRMDLIGQRISLTAQGLQDLIQILFIQALTIWGGYQVLHEHLLLGEMLAFTMMAASLQQTISQIGGSFLHLAVLKPQLAMVRDILEPQAEPVPFFNSERTLEGPILIQDVAFRYHPDQPWIFKNFNFMIAPGEKVVLRGPSGCGKSTLLRLIASLYTPQMGKIAIGGIAPSQAKAILSYLPQSIRLFNGSIMENLRLFSGGAGREALMAAAEITRLNDLVANLPMGFETIICQGGDNFSGGQRQLIALTAVAASARQVMLLDEAMANLDPIAKERLFASELLHGKTVLLACHEDVQDPRGPEHHGFCPILLGPSPATDRNQEA